MKPLRIRKCLIALSGTLAALAPSVAAPINDSFSDATAITGVTARITGSNFDATKEPGEPDHAGSAGGHSVWWKWTAPEAGLVSVSTAGTEFYALLAVYTGGSVTGLAPIASDCNGGANSSSVTRFTAEAGTTYWIAVDGRDGATGAITLLLDADGYDFTTLAGSIGYGTRDGVGANARFSNPDALAVDRLGNLYVADRDNHTVRRVSPDGVVTTLAGSAGTSGSADGLGAAARFLRPGGITVDSAGNVFVADTGNFTIRKVTPAGSVTTIAGLAGAWGAEDGIGAAARFRSVQALAIDGADTIFAADTTNSTIRKLTSLGVVTTLAGSAGSFGSEDGTGTAARFRFPNGVAIDVGGNVYVADTLNETIRRITPGGTVTTVAGTPGITGHEDGDGSAAEFHYPWGVTVDRAGDIWVADYVNCTIRRMTSDGTVITVAGSAPSTGSADGSGSAARFFYPTAVAADSSGNVYVTDSLNNTVRRVAPGGAVTTLAGLAAGWPGLFWATSADDGDLPAVESQTTDSATKLRFPQGVAVDAAGIVYVADTYRQVIRKIPATGEVTTLAGAVDQAGSADGLGDGAGFYDPAQIAVDTAGNVYVADSWNHSIRIVTPAGQVSTIAGDTGGPGGSNDGIGTAARFFYPEGVAVDRERNVFVADSGNHTIRKVTPGGVVSTLAGLAGSFGNADGAGTAARFSWPRGIAVDATGNLYVADSQNHVIRQITAAGVVTTLAGSAGVAGDSDGPAAEARFRFPSGVALDDIGNVYVTDYGNQTIRRITAAGWVTTIGGRPGFFGGDDGVGSAARFFGPRGIAVDDAGDLYIADTENHAIRRASLTGALAITAQPQSQTVTAGANVTFAVGVRCMSPPTFQWYRNDASIAGATAATLTLTNVQTADAGGYRVNLVHGSQRQTSAAATLTVNSASNASPSASGGGSIAPWFLAALALLGLGRRTVSPAARTGRPPQPRFCGRHSSG